MSASIELAGYQGAESLLTAALKHFRKLLADSGAFGTVTMRQDVTAKGESARSLFDSVESGRRQICYVASPYLAARVSELGVLDVPFSVSDRLVAFRALDSVTGDHLTSAIHRSTDLKVLGYWDNGFRHISNAVRPVRTVTDCTGLSIRTLDNTTYRDALNCLGFRAATTDVKDMVTVLASGAISAQENPLTNFISFSLWKYHPFLSLTAQFFGVLLLVCHRPWFDGLSRHAQATLQHVAELSTGLQRCLAAEADALALQRLPSLGVSVTTSQDIDIASFRAASQSVTAALQRTLPSELWQSYIKEPM